MSTTLFLQSRVSVKPITSHCGVDLADVSLLYMVRRFGYSTQPYCKTTQASCKQQVDWNDQKAEKAEWTTQKGKGWAHCNSRTSEPELPNCRCGDFESGSPTWTAQVDECAWKTLRNAALRIPALRSGRNGGIVRAVKNSPGALVPCSLVCIPSGRNR